MKKLSTKGIIIRRIEYGEADLIITFITQKYGKISAIAKSAKKSIKRFGPILELFSELEIILHQGQGSRPLILEEASVVKAFNHIRSNYISTAYACYWSEIIYSWFEERHDQSSLYYLLKNVLQLLNDHLSGYIYDQMSDKMSDKMSGHIPGKSYYSPDILSILFQMRFLVESGFSPNLNKCDTCKTKLDDINNFRIQFDPKKGSIICSKCCGLANNLIPLSKGTIKQLIWVSKGNIEIASRIRFASKNISEGLYFLESFLPYCLDKQPKSLSFLKKIRKIRECN